MKYETAVSPWSSVSASEMIDLRDEGQLSEAVPSAPGIYVWKRHFDVAKAEQLPPQDLQVWVQAVCAQAAARLPGAAITHCVRTDGINIGGGELPPDKLRMLDEVSQTSKRRRLLLRFIEYLSCFTPPIYIGQAKDLQRRVREHLDGNTSLHSYVHQTLGLTWQDVVFFYLRTAPTPEATDTSNEEAFRELLELTAQRLLAPFAVRRPG